MQLVVTEKAYQAIVEECASFPEVETGGILIGKKIGKEIVIAFALGSGPKAQRSWTRFSPDVEWQQTSLEKLFNQYGANYVGSFHRHPGKYFQPSPLDRKTAREILFSPDWNVSEAVFPIIILRGTGIEFYPYYLSRNLEDFQSIQWRIVSDECALAKAVLGGEMNPKIIVSEDLFRELLRSPAGTDLYGIPRMEENIIQIQSLDPRDQLIKVARLSSDRVELEDLRFSIPLREIESISLFDEFTSRSRGIVDTDDLKKKKVVFIGLGSVGSQVALHLAQSAVGSFSLFDSDTFSAPNLSRHACDLNDLGRHKVLAVKDLILRRNPRAGTEVFAEDFLSLNRKAQLARLEGSDLVIASTDSNAVQFLANEICFELRIPSLYVGCYERACAGEILFVIPGQTPCFNCFMEFRQTNLKEMKKKERHIPYTDEDPSSFKGEPGLAIDISYVVSIASAYALALLLPGSERNSALIDPERNLILVHSGNQPQEKYKEIFQMPFDLLRARVKRDEECLVCQKEIIGESNGKAANLS